MSVEGVHGSLKVGSDHSMDSCPISIQGNSTSMDSICEATEGSNPRTNKQTNTKLYRYELEATVFNQVWLLYCNWSLYRLSFQSKGWLSVAPLESP